MGEISLVVTSGVLNEVYVRGHQYQKQISIKNATDDIQILLDDITHDNNKRIILGNSVSFKLGDNAAIWRNHNDDATEQFNDLFDLLSRNPNTEFRCLCKIEQ